MITNELKSYVDALKKAQPPVSADYLRKELAGVGWPASDIEESVSYFYANSPSRVPADATKKQDVSGSPVSAISKAVSSAMVGSNWVTSVTGGSSSGSSSESNGSRNLNSGYDLTPDEIFRNSGLVSTGRKQPTAASTGADPGTSPVPSQLQKSVSSVVSPEKIPSQSAVTRVPGIANPLIESEKTPEARRLMPAISPSSRAAENSRPSYQNSSVMPPVKKGKGKILGILAILVFLALAATAAYLYFYGGLSFSKAPYDEEHLLRDISAGLRLIKSADAKFEFAAAVKNRDADAKPFVGLEIVRDEKSSRDEDRFRDLSKILDALGEYKVSKGKYPASLADIVDVSANDPSGAAYDYSPADNGKEFSLKMTFETPEAKTQAAIGSGRSLEEGSAVFDSKSSRYYYFNGGESSLGSLMPSPNSPGFFTLVPSDMRLVFSFEGPVIIGDESVLGSEAGAVSSRGFEAKVKADVNWTPIQFSSDLTVVYSADKVYAKFNKAPKINFLFFNLDLKPIENKWIELAGEELMGTIADFSGFGAGGAETLRDDALSSYADLIAMADAEKVLYAKKPPTREDSPNGGTAYKYDLALSRDRFVNFYKRAMLELELDLPADMKLDSGLLNYLEDATYQPLFDYFYDNVVFSIWADSETGTPVKGQIALRLVPPDSAENLSEKQLVVLSSVLFSNINNPKPVSVPTEAISLDQAQMLLSGKTEKEFKFTKQVGNIEDIRSALESYNYFNKTYPESLTELTKEPESDGAAEGYTYTYRLLEKIPTDVYGQSPFIYQKTAKGYTLKYYIEVSEYKSGYLPGDLVARTYLTSGKTKIMLRAVEGNNTATESVFSSEAASASKSDKDADGLPDAVEKLVGTSPNKKDTDSDGASDNEEITSGYNPLGAGKLETTGSSGGSWILPL
ncbi:MAG: hypothetical protein A3G59_02470 [Candidatus Taylorbacteria bacterium RIFCSPLOWO2_12_FULL_47_20]|uniref:Type II secretion system protein GspG C-terminal domain-containing protein n=2 Tax=Candidatus Tayloriibacteriota TaxID=1817919 RepID=A0A1G2PAB1_9BACT|nr:MAG: hypothetical protein A3H68_00220 [Candidatus Taylorbacteria bacterium RIFCSPLOWO2_02_FULL_46_40]OHA44541.1 MAG: hypothetical protein A3G59_02470 [Candidatus Taylorbacteria bacterium RIFCSPLOWO2_12_FULL_47_20]